MKFLGVNLVDFSASWCNMVNVANIRAQRPITEPWILHPAPYLYSGNLSYPH